jgi:hypothetical protein
MVECDVLEDETRESPVRPRRTHMRPQARHVDAEAVASPKHPAPTHAVCLKTDGRHFFFAPSLWSVHHR